MELISHVHSISTQLHELIMKQVCIFPCALFIIWCTLLCSIVYCTFAHGTKQGFIHKITHSALSTIWRLFEDNFDYIDFDYIWFSYYRLTLEPNSWLNVAPLCGDYRPYRYRLLCIGYNFTWVLAKLVEKVLAWGEVVISWSISVLSYNY